MADVTGIGLSLFPVGALVMGSAQSTFGDHSITSATQPEPANVSQLSSDVTYLRITCNNYFASRSQLFSV
jgi:hypothetical protein